MGNKSTRRCSTMREAEFFEQKKRDQLKYFTTVSGFLENSSEWLVLFREEFSKYSKFDWSKSVLNVIKHWKSFQDHSSKVAFVWNTYNSIRNIQKVDHSKACLWAQSIVNLQTFSYEVEINPHKRTLNGFLTENKGCTLYRLIKSFKKSFVDHYCHRTTTNLILKREIMDNIQKFSPEIDDAILGFISIIVKIIPKFFLDLPKNVQDIEGVVRNAIIADEILSLLVLVRKETSNEVKDQYVKGLESFGELSTLNETLDRLEKDSNYFKAMKNLQEITECKSIGEMHDAVAMLMNHISMSLYDVNNPGYVMTEEEIVEAFLMVIGKSSTCDLPHYVDILNKFLDKNTLDIKDVGKGIHKITFIVNNAKDWSSFVGHR